MNTDYAQLETLRNEFKPDYTVTWRDMVVERDAIIQQYHDKLAAVIAWYAAQNATTKEHLRVLGWPVLSFEAEAAQLFEEWGELWERLANE